jgi:DNA repair exonuclease SbcCD ATPase subunit
MSPKQDEISSIKEQQKELLDLLLELKNSSSASEKVIKSLDESNRNQQQILQENSYLRQKVEEIHLSVYDPDRGIYKRINDSLNYHQKNTEDIEDLKKNSEELEEKIETLDEDLTGKINNHKEEINGLIKESKAIKKIAGDDLEHISSLVWIQKHGKKLLWLGLTSLVTLLITQFGSLFTFLF